MHTELLSDHFTTDTVILYFLFLSEGTAVSE